MAKATKETKAEERKATQVRTSSVTTVGRKDTKLQIVGLRKVTSPARETPKVKRVKEKAQVRKAQKAPERKVQRLLKKPKSMTEQKRNQLRKRKKWDCLR